jgi:hypothetical protein
MPDYSREYVAKLEREAREDFALRLKLEDRITQLQEQKRRLAAVLIDALQNTKD